MTVKVDEGKHGRTIYVTCNRTFAQNFRKPKKLLLSSFNKARKEKKNKSTVQLITNSIAYSWIAKKSHHQLQLDVLTVGKVLSLNTSLCPVQSRRAHEKLNC